MMSPEKGPLNLIITGVGGQGNVLISHVLGQALVEAGYKVAVGETFGLSQRGGSVSSHLRVSPDRIYSALIPKAGAHVVLGLEPMETLRILGDYGQPGVKVVVNSRPIAPLNVIAGQDDYPPLSDLKDAMAELTDQVWWLDGTEVAGKLGAAVMANMVLLGALIGAGLMPVEASVVEKSMTDLLPPSHLKSNLKAFKRGIELI